MSIAPFFPSTSHQWISSHVSGFYFPQLKDEVEVLSAVKVMSLYLSSAVREGDRIQGMLHLRGVDLINLILSNKEVSSSPTQQKPGLTDFRVVAYPVHADDSNIEFAHWTLGLLVNISWKKGTVLQEAHDWHVFHFDSLCCNERSLPNATDIARRILNGGEEILIQSHEVSVPRQPPGSNNCGLYPAHFLRIFLSDVEGHIQHCLSVCG